MATTAIESTGTAGADGNVELHTYGGLSKIGDIFLHDSGATRKNRARFTQFSMFWNVKQNPTTFFKNP